jgi:hypothetical protein
LRALVRALDVGGIVTVMKLCPFIAVAFLVSSCVGPVSYGTNYPPTSAQAVEVVHLGQLQRPYEIIGECRLDSLLHDARKAKEQAAKMGADAVSIPERKSQGLSVAYAIKWK